MIVHREYLTMLTDLLLSTANSRNYLWTIESREAYLNTSWQLIKQVERKLIAEGK
jgi:hypothetical protein